MAQENQIGIDDLIKAIKQQRIKFFLESESAELELKVADQKEENGGSKVSILGTFSGAGLDGLHTLKVKNDTGDQQGGSKPVEKESPSNSAIHPDISTQRPKCPNGCS